MASCEKCWADAGGDPDRYAELGRERAASPCTPEEQAGPDALWCYRCARRTLHQHARVCTACGGDGSTPAPGGPDGKP